MNGLFAPRLSLLLTLAHQMKSVPSGMIELNLLLGNILQTNLHFNWKLEWISNAH